MSFRVVMGSASVSIQFAVPCWKPGVGSGYADRIAVPLGLSWDVGTMFPGNGFPVVGSFTTRTFVKNGLDAFSKSLKSPLRMAAVGTVEVLVWSLRYHMNSCVMKKNNFLRSVLNFPGIVTGPPMV